MSEISRKAASFTESVIREMTRLAMENDAVNLAQGFPDFACPPELKEAARPRSTPTSTSTCDHLGCEGLSGGDRRQDRADFTRGWSVDPMTSITVPLWSNRRDDRVDARAPRSGRRGDRLRAVRPGYGPDAVLSGAVPRYVTLHEPDWSIDFEEPAQLASGPQTRGLVLRTRPTTRLARSSPAPS